MMPVVLQIKLPTKEEALQKIREKLTELERELIEAQLVVVEEPQEKTQEKPKE